MTCSARLGFLSILIFTAIGLVGCKDDPSIILPPDEVEKERFPCTGKWCFDESNPQVKELLDEYYGLMDPELVDTLAEVYASCNYTDNGNGMVTVDCPQWAKDSLLTQCPQNWFSFLSFVGSVRAPEEEGGLLYCFPETDRAVTAKNGFFCADGYVNPGYAASTPEQRLPGKGPGTRCFRAEDCEVLEETLWPSKEKSCFYSDFSHISEGQPATVDCATLAEGECSINCSCPSLGVEVVGMAPSCNHLSPTRAVGICGYASCSEDKWCSIEGVLEAKCLTRTSLPSWVQAFKEERESSTGRPVLWGTCVQPDHYENWRGKDGALFQYGEE